MRKHWFLLSALSVLMAFTVSCKKERQKKDIIIAVIPKVDNAIFDQVKESCMKAANDLGITVTWEAPTSSDAARQRELIENLIKYKVDGILISCNDVEALKETINKADSLGIKVATFDSDCPGSKRVFYIGTDNRKAGKVCAETLNKLYQKAGKTPQKVAVMSGGPNADNLAERLAGFKSGFDSNRISNVLYSFEMPDFGSEILSYELTKNKDINGIQMVWGAMALTGVDSIPVLANFIKKGGVTVFFDVSKPLLRFIQKNPNCATMKQDFKSMGYDGVFRLYDVLQGRSVKSEILYDVTVIDQSNAEEEFRKL